MSVKNEKELGPVSEAISRLSRVGDADGLGQFNFSRFFGGINKPHTEEEVEKSLIVGTSSTTPSINEVDLEYPQPWLFFRLIIGSIILFYGFVFAYEQFENSNLIPGVIITGSFAVPISTLFLFFELNIRRNIHLWQVLRLVLFGGLLSLLIALLVFENTDFLEDSMGASVAGLVEEPAKLGALLLLMKGKRKYPYILNGLLLGASVGCGFAAFESAGYALNVGLYSRSFDSLVENIQMRGLLSPFAHIVWSGVAGAALWRVKKAGDFYLGLLQKKEFYMPFGIIVACHAIWNSTFSLPFMGKYIICGVVSWIIALSLVNLGIKQIASEKKGEFIFRR
ncbi:PrsW family intramembrane metalloprotease [Prochlorococcus sp. MIT 1300]|uniref:PrsW family intramembrane metalloprotease n=1 Tax=Prochlorococcus sp. MIT 1300 TaxID=3096218 RepID=UPI002A74D57F|nr:PrsW family glutamic-type intramembrane protease [Prochlorococcus sp. MIT 1300]